MMERKGDACGVRGWISQVAISWMQVAASRARDMHVLKQSSISFAVLTVLLCSFWILPCYRILRTLSCYRTLTYQTLTCYWPK